MEYQDDGQPHIRVKLAYGEQWGAVWYRSLGESITEGLKNNPRAELHLKLETINDETYIIGRIVPQEAPDATATA